MKKSRRKSVKGYEAEMERERARLRARDVAGWSMTKIAKALNAAPGYADLTQKFFGGQRLPRVGGGRGAIGETPCLLPRRAARRHTRRPPRARRR